MKPYIGYSSEIYDIEIQDVVSLPDTTADLQAAIRPTNEISILIGNQKLGTRDSLAYGREMINQALTAGQTHVPVRFCFISVIPRWHIIPLFLKKFRYQYKYFNSNIYHLSANRLRELGLERGRRTAANAYAITNKRWVIPEEERVKKYQDLVKSLQNGFSDDYPISIMLCRTCGAKDSIDNGHHRMGICIEMGIDRICTNFIAAGTAPHWFQKLYLAIKRTNKNS